MWPGFQMKIVFILNNRSNRLSKKLPGLERYCQNVNLGSVQFLQTLRKKHAIELAKQATENGCDYLIAIGGDGTLHEVINGVMQSNLPANLYPAIGVLPFGSANDFARNANISSSVEELIERIQTNTTRKIDLGKIILHQTAETRYFINIAGVGLGAEVVQSLEQTSSILGPGYNYFKHIIKGFLSYEKKEVSCKGTTWHWKGKLLQMAVANGRSFGNGIRIAPDARISDGRLQVSIFGDLSIWDYLKNLRNLKIGVKIRHPEVSYHPSREVLVESREACSIEADGEYVGLVPATISVLPRTIRFLMPPEAQ